jgi:hypothetical protein
MAACNIGNLGHLQVVKCLFGRLTSSWQERNAGSMTKKGNSQGTLKVGAEYCVNDVNKIMQRLIRFVFLIWMCAIQSFLSTFFVYALANLELHHQEW